MSKLLGDWGKMTPANESGSVHYTQTNGRSHDGPDVHVTTQVENTSIRDRFDQNGNYQGTTWGENK